MRDLERYFKGLRVPQGRLVGQAFTLLPWQKRFLRGAFKPNIKTAALSIARGNGKTTLVAGLAAASLNGCLAQRRGDVICVASSFLQGRIIFEHVIALMGDELASKVWRVQDSAARASIENRQTGARVRCIGCDPKRAHGLAPALVLADEPAQWERNESNKMFAALQTSLGKMPNSKLIALGTQPADKNHWFASLLRGGGDYAQIHASDASGGALFTLKSISKANPSLRVMADLKEAIQKEAKMARKDASMLPSFRALRLNQGTADTEQSMLLDADTWQAIEDDAERWGDVVWGIDCGSGTAMSAVACFWVATGRLECIAAYPGEPNLAERGVRDGVADLYERMAKEGHLFTVAGKVVPNAVLVKEAQKRFGNPVAIASDRWRQNELLQAFDDARLPRCAVEWRGQGWRDGAEDVRHFRKACLSGRVKPIKSLLLRSAIGEACTVCDAAGNEKLSKNTEGMRRKRARDDAAAASILAVALAMRGTDDAGAVRHEKKKSLILAVAG